MARAEAKATTGRPAKVESGSTRPAIADYGLIGDCHTAALVSTEGSVDWYCVPRFDGGSCFGRLLDWDRGGYCSIQPDGEDDWQSFQQYVEDTLVLATTFRTASGQARVLDCLSIRRDGPLHPHRQLLRVVEGQRGFVTFTLRVVPRFDYGYLEPWLSHENINLFTAVGGDDAMIVGGDADFHQAGNPQPQLEAHFSVRGEERVRVSLVYVRPDDLDRDPPRRVDPQELDARLDDTLAFWRGWRSRFRLEGPKDGSVVRSALVLKALTYARSGSIVAAPTTSLPEAHQSERNWDYRSSWIRDSTFAVRSLTELGYEEEADHFRLFIHRSAAGSANELKMAYGIAGERRIQEQELGGLTGYRGAQPVRVGNRAAEQLQLDAYGDLAELTWRWHQRGRSPDDDQWRFLLNLVDAAIERWQEADHGIWEWRSEPRHFVHSKVMCWAAVDRGLRLAEACMRSAPTRRWERAREEIREAIFERGYDRERGVFVQAFDVDDLDAAVLLIPTVDFLAYDDERMISTADRIREELDCDGLIRRYTSDDSLEGKEGAFIACSFWLAECYARQQRQEEARLIFDRAAATANHLGLFAEEYDPEADEMLGNFPQALSHLSHLTAALALGEQRPIVAD
jgi:GH15 family glucan-1,4-alpha-glucosidase